MVELIPEQIVFFTRWAKLLAEPKKDAEELRQFNEMSPMRPKYRPRICFPEKSHWNNEIIY